MLPWERGFPSLRAYDLLSQASTIACGLHRYDSTHHQSLPLLALAPKPPEPRFSMSLRALSRPVSRIVPSNQYWEWLILQTPKAVQQKCTSVLALTFFSTVWRVILRFRENDGVPSLLSLTLSSYTERTPRPTNPILRPAYQGSNPVADIFSMWALRTTVKYLPRIAKDNTDHEARSQMLCVFFWLYPS